jgi:outer membrane protein TolC
VFIKNLQKIVSNIEKLENMVKSMIDEGYAKKVDLLEVQAKKASVVRMLNIAKYNRELAYQYLSFLLNQEVKSIQTIYSPAPAISLSTKDILEKNIDIQKAKMGYSITAMAIELEKSAFKPVAGAFAEYGSADDTPLGEFSDHDFYTIAFRLSGIYLMDKLINKN